MIYPNRVIPAAQEIRDILAFNSPAELLGLSQRDIPLADYQNQIALQYLAAPVFSVDAVPSYSAFIAELKYQFNVLLSRGVQFEFTDDDPTPTNERGGISHKKFYETYADTGVLKIYRSDGSHPILDRHGISVNTGNDIAHFETMNTIFRAVHDYLGHLATGGSFAWDGETTAYYSHASTFTLAARRALFTETVAQQCTYAILGDYVDQKGIILHTANIYPTLD